MATTQPAQDSRAELREHRKREAEWSEAFAALGDDGEIVARLLARFFPPALVADLTGAEVSDQNRCPEGHDRLVRRHACGCATVFAYGYSASGATGPSGQTFNVPCCDCGGMMSIEPALVLRVPCADHLRAGGAACSDCMTEAVQLRSDEGDRQLRALEEQLAQESRAEMRAEQEAAQQERVAAIAATDPTFPASAACGCSQRFDLEAGELVVDWCPAHATRLVTTGG